MQVPPPLQKPFVPQEVGPASSHSLRGSVPAEEAMQVPTLPAASQV
jgi:hypothetical protein